MTSASSSHRVSDGYDVESLHSSTHAERRVSRAHLRPSGRANVFPLATRTRARSIARARARASGGRRYLLGEAFFTSERSRRITDACVSACVLACSVGYAIVLASVVCGVGGRGRDARVVFVPGGVEALFESSTACCAGFIHYLAFDLYLGRALLKRERECGVPTVLRVCVTAPLTFVAGPVGYGVERGGDGGRSGGGRRARARRRRRARRDDVVGCRVANRVRRGVALCVMMILWIWFAPGSCSPISCVMDDAVSDARGGVGPGEFSAQVSRPSRRVRRARLARERVVRDRTVSDSPVGQETVSSRAQNRGTRLLRALGEHDARIRLDSSTRLAFHATDFHARARRAGESMDPVPTSGIVLRARRTRGRRVVQGDTATLSLRRRRLVDEKFRRPPRVDMASPRRRSRHRPAARLHLGAPSLFRSRARVWVFRGRRRAPKPIFRRLARVQRRRRRAVLRVVRLVSHPRNKMEIVVAFENDVDVDVRLLLLLLLPPSP